MPGQSIRYIRRVSVMYCQTCTSKSTWLGTRRIDKTCLGFPWHGRYCADFAFLQGINDATFANVGISNESNRNLLLI